jgi:Cu(I)/Ag(I) efflux system membrane fusion protein
MKLIQNKYLQIALLILIGLIIGIAIPKSNSNEPTTIAEEHEHSGLWSCSMHPQIVSETKGSCPICGMDLTPMEENGGLDPSLLLLTEDAAKAAQLSTYVISEGQQSNDNIELSGTLKANLDEQFSEISYVSGRIDYLANPSPGTNIQKGSLIAKLYSPELIAAQQELFSLAKAKDTEADLYNAVVQKFENWNFNEAQIEEFLDSKTVQNSIPIYAKQSGTITEVFSKEGDWIKAGQKILSAVSLNTVWVELEVYESDINHFKKGQLIDLTIDALSNKKKTAQIDFIDPIMDSKKRITKVRASISNADGALKPGMFVRAKAVTKSTKSILIPASAVLWTGKQSLVYVKSPTAPTYSLREVSLLDRRGDWYAIEKGLEIGEEIVKNGTFVIDAAAQLAGKTSMINQ